MVPSLEEPVASCKNSPTGKSDLPCQPMLLVTQRKGPGGGVPQCAYTPQSNYLTPGAESPQPGKVCETKPSEESARTVALGSWQGTEEPITAPGGWPPPQVMVLQGRLLSRGGTKAAPYFRTGTVRRRAGWGQGQGLG